LFCSTFKSSTRALGSGFLAHSVLQFSQNGGKRAYIARIAGNGAAPASITVAGLAP